MRLTGTECVPLQRSSQNEARRPGMGKSIAKARLCQRGKGLDLATFDLPLLNPLPLPKYSHPLPMPCHSYSTRSITELLATTDSATDYRAPASLSLLVCHTGSPRWFATQALLPQLVALAASPSSMPFVDTLLPTLKILPRSSPSSATYFPLHVTQTRHTDSYFPQILRRNLQLSVALLLQPPPLLRSAIRIPSSELPPQPLLSVSVSTWSTLQ